MIGFDSHPDGVRLSKGTALTKPETLEKIRKAHDWLPRQWQLIEGMLMELQHAEQQRAHWRSLIAQEVLADPLLLSMFIRVYSWFATGGHG